VDRDHEGLQINGIDQLRTLLNPGMYITIFPEEVFCRSMSSNQCDILIVGSFEGPFRLGMIVEKMMHRYKYYTVIDDVMNHIAKPFQRSQHWMYCNPAISDSLRAIAVGRPIMLRSGFRDCIVGP
jgi:hypothetical protein